MSVLGEDVEDLAFGVTEEVEGYAVEGELGACTGGYVEELSLRDVLFLHVALGVVVGGEHLLDIQPVPNHRVITDRLFLNLLILLLCFPLLPIPSSQLRIQPHIDLTQRHINLPIDLLQVGHYQKLILLVLVRQLIDNPLFVPKGCRNVLDVEVEEGLFFQILEFAQEEELVDPSADVLVLVGHIDWLLRDLRAPIAPLEVHVVVVVCGRGLVDASAVYRVPVRVLAVQLNLNL